MKGLPQHSRKLRFCSTSVPSDSTGIKPVAPVRANLRDLVKLELFAKEEPQQIAAIWNEYHKNFYCISACVEGPLYKTLQSLWQAYPIFLIPLPRGEGALFFVFQYRNDRVGFTSLAEYKRDAVNAPKALTIMHYTELLPTKSIVLMRGEIDPNQLTVEEAQLLAHQMQLYYLDKERYALVRTFNERPHEFNYNDLLSLTLPGKKEDH